VIVRQVPAGLELITQPDHARLARRIMEHCVPLASRPRRQAILRAIGEHDDGWLDEDTAPAVDANTGEVVDFIRAPLAVRQGVWPRTVARLADEPWAAALVAEHALTAYERFRFEPEWATFFADLTATRDGLLRSTRLSLDELRADYLFVRLGDLISLAFCTGRPEPQEFRGWTIQLSGARVVVTPDLFGGATLPIEIRTRELSGAHFGSDRELRAAFHAADVTGRHGEVAAAPVS
jgi:hypothetical protein